MHHEEPTRLQALSAAFADKAAMLVDLNERALALRTGVLHGADDEEEGGRRGPADGERGGRRTRMGGRGGGRFNDHDGGGGGRGGYGDRGGRGGRGRGGRGGRFNDRSSGVMIDEIG